MRHNNAPSLCVIVGLLVVLLSASLAVPAPPAVAASQTCVTPPYPVEWNPVAGKSNSLQVHIKFVEDGDKCGFEDGNVKITKVGETTPTEYDAYCWWNDTTPPYWWCNAGTLAFEEEGSYVADFWVKLCNNIVGQCTEGTHTWTFTVGPVCGGKGTLPLATATPTGTIDNDRPTIQAAFSDPSLHACGVAKWEFKLDGVTVPVTPATVGNQYILTYTPPAPLAIGPHSVYAYVEEFPGNYYCETCFDKGSHSWSFTVDFCGTKPLVLSSFEPAGTVGETQPLIRATFTDNDHPCDLDTVVFLVDNLPVEPSRTRSGGLHVLSHVPPVPLAPGPHRVDIAIVERGYYKNAGGASWSFNVLTDMERGVTYEDDYPGAIVTFTADKLTIEQTCGPLGTCVGPYTVPYPAQASIAFDLAPMTADLAAGYTMEKYGPFTVTVPTPFGPFPVTVCAGASDCIFPKAKTEGTVIDGSVTLTLTTNGQTTQHTVPLHITG